MSDILPDTLLTTWGTKIANSSDYKNATPDQQIQAQHDFFTNYVAPAVGKDKVDDAQKQWAFATSDPAQYRSSNEFLNLNSNTRKEVLRDSLLAQGNTVAPTTNNDFNIPVHDPAVNAAYSQFEQDPKVKELSAKASQLALGSPLFAVAEKGGALVNSITGSEDAKAVEEAGKRAIAEKDALQKQFPGSKFQEAAEQGLLLGGIGGKVAGAVDAAAPMATTNAVGDVVSSPFTTKVANIAGNAVGNTAGSVALTPENTNNVGSATATEAAGNLALNTAAQSAFPVLSGAKNLIMDTMGGKSAVLNTIDNAITRVANRVGISRKQAANDLMNDLAVAPTNEVTPAGVQSTAAGVSSTSNTSSDILNEATTLAPDKEGLLNTSINNKAADIKQAVENTTVPYTNALDITNEARTASGLPIISRLARPMYNDATVIANQMPIGTAQDLVDLTTNTTHYSTGSALNRVEQEAVANSPTVQSVVKEAQQGKQVNISPTQTLTPDYQSLASKYGADVADKAVEAGQVQKFNPGNPAAPASQVQQTPYSATEWEQRINSLDAEIKKLPADSDAAHALISVQKQWQGKLDEVYKANPGLQHAVERAEEVHAIDKTVNTFEDMTKTLDPTNAITESGQLQKNIDPTNVKAFLTKYGTPDAIAAAKDTMTPTNFKNYQEAIDNVRAIERTGKADTALGSDNNDVAEGLAVAAVHGATHAIPTTAVTKARYALRTALNKGYGEALNTIYSDPVAAQKFVKDAMLRKDSTDLLRQRYQEVVQPLISPAVNTATEMYNQGGKGGQYNSPTAPLQLNIDKSAKDLAPTQPTEAPSSNWLNFTP